MFAKVYSAQPVYLSAELITVEADLSRGLHSFTVVGLPDKAVEESRDRVSAAIKNSDFPSPKSQNRKVVISLAPADIRKEGPAFDLPMALAYLIASGDIAFDPEKTLFIGELSLDGDIRPVRGVLAIAKAAKNAGFQSLFVPRKNAAEAALIPGIHVYGVESLRQVLAHIDEKLAPEKRRGLVPEKKTPFHPTPPADGSDFADIRGQESAKRGLEIAAAGRHNIALYGPPGTGKTMLARAFTHILPPLSIDEALEVTAIHSIAGALERTLITEPPFRSPHHTASYVSLVGGGATPRPGEATLAHRGVLFCDEFPEFDRRAIDALREPLEEGIVSVSRAKGTVSFPANFILVAAMNPTRGHGESGAEALRERERFRKKISGPIVDRIDMWIEVPHVAHEQLTGASVPGETARMRERVQAARRLQIDRFGSPSKTNSDMTVQDIERMITVPESAVRLLRDSARNLSLSPRSYHRILKLARTIADLEENERLEEGHILEALQYRPRQLFD